MNKVEGNPVHTGRAVAEGLSDYLFWALHTKVRIRARGQDRDRDVPRVVLSGEFLQRLEEELESRNVRLDRASTEGWQQGHCPLHEDRHPSFSVNFQASAWYCFSGCGGGTLSGLAARLGLPVPEKLPRYRTPRMEGDVHLDEWGRKITQRAFGKIRTDNVYHLFSRYPPRNAEVGPIVLERYGANFGIGSLPSGAGLFSYPPGYDLPIHIESPYLALSKEELIYLVECVEGENSRMAGDVRRCKRKGAWCCSEHGIVKEKGTSSFTCKQPFHDCPSKSTRRVRVANLPDLEDGSQYRAVVIAQPFIIDGDDPEDMSGHLKNEHTAALVYMQRVRHRKRIQGALLCRAEAYYLGCPTAVLHHKFLFHEEAPGDMDGVIEEICDHLNGIVAADHNFTGGEAAVEQMVSFSLNHLIGIAEHRREELFAAFLYAFVDTHTDLFFTTGSAFAAVRQANAHGTEERPRCPQCNRPLRLTLIQEGAPQEPVSATAPTHGPPDAARLF